MNKKVFIVFFTIILGITGIALFFREPSETKAGAGDNVFGFAWAGVPQAMPPEKLGLGWISFNCNNPEFSAPRCSQTNYGVNIENDGNLTGFAYYDMNDPKTTVDEVGWINFEPSLAGRPGLPNLTARVDLDGTVCGGVGYLCGWARVIGHDNSWTGWIKLRNHIGDAGPNYGVYINTNSGEFNGWAWGSDVMGWINFRGLAYGVETDFSFREAPSASGLRIDSTSYCRPVPREGHIAISWLYGGEDSQVEYRLQIAQNPGFSHPVIDKLIPQIIEPDSRGTSGFNVVPSPRGGELEVGYNRNYWSRIKARDNQGVWSLDWSNVITFSTPRHAYPWPEFSWVSQRVVVGKPVAVTNNSKCFDINNNETPCSSWSWVIPADAVFAGGTSASSIEPHIQFASPGDNSVRLTTTDANGNSCSKIKIIEVRLSDMDWEEIFPN